MPKNNTPDTPAPVVFDGQGLCIEDVVALPEPLTAFLGALSLTMALVDEDRALDRDLQGLLLQIREGSWNLYGT